MASRSHIPPLLTSFETEPRDRMFLVVFVGDPHFTPILSLDCLDAIDDRQRLLADAVIRACRHGDRD